MDAMDRLCRHCSPLLNHAQPPGASPLPHHETVGSLVASAKSCALCRVIQDYSLLNYLQGRFPELRGEGSDELPLTLRLESENEGTGVWWFVLAGQIEARKRKFFAPFDLTVTRCAPDIQGSEGPLWKGRESSFEEKCEVIESWFTDCVANHPECNPEQNGLPERLIDVGGRRDENLRVVNTREAGISKAAYAALSHCWGGAQPVTTTTDNIEQLQQALRFGSLPKTFREAVLVTRRLGIPYLWIDSLCIMQNDQDDWAREAGRMLKTYSGSALVISAMDGNNCEQGCFVETATANSRLPGVRKENEEAGLPMDAQGSTGEREEVCQISVLPLDQETSTLLRVYRGNAEHPDRIAVLRQRGWTLQEELLARREILCCRPELRWKCQRLQRTESGHQFPRVRSPYSWFDGCDSPPEGVNRLWCDWMRDYSTRSFTFESDRLSALVGIVQHYQRLTGYRHILGCWEETMMTDLFWLRGRNAADPGSALASIPSWSWLTRAKDVEFDFWGWHARAKDGTEEEHARMIEADIVWAGQPLLSELLSSKLILEGPTQEMRLRVDPRALDYNPPYLLVGDEEPEVSIEKGDPIPWSCAGMFDEAQRTRLPEHQIFTCLLIKSRQYPGAYKQEDFLILQNVEKEDGRDDVFRRVGIAMIESKDGTTRFGEATTKRIGLE